MLEINVKVNKMITDDEILSLIKKSNVGKKIINDLKLTDQEIIDNFEMLENYILSENTCSNCKCMNDCHKSTLGYKYSLKRDIDGSLTDFIAICDKFKEHYQRKNNISYTTFNKDDLLDENQSRFFLDNAKMLGNDFALKIVKLYKKEKVSGAFVTLKDSKIRLKLIKSLAYNLLKNNKVSIVKMSDMLKDIKAGFNDDDYKNVYNDVLLTDILIIDGLGNESVSNWSRDEILLSLIDNRIQQDKVTILCSEFTIEELKKVYNLTRLSEDIKAEQIINKIKELNNN